MIDYNLYLMSAAAIGSIGYTAYGFMQAKSKNPNIKFDYKYAYAAIGAIAGTALLYGNPIDSINATDLIEAFLVGFGGNNAITKIKRK
jgi:hypothetical protein